MAAYPILSFLERLIADLADYPGRAEDIGRLIAGSCPLLPEEHVAVRYALSDHLQTLYLGVALYDVKRRKAIDDYENGDVKKADEAAVFEQIHVCGRLSDLFEELFWLEAHKAFNVPHAKTVVIDANFTFCVLTDEGAQAFIARDEDPDDEALPLSIPIERVH